MKRIMCFLVMGAVVLGMAVSMSACGGNGGDGGNGGNGGNGDGNNPELKNFKIEVANVSKHEISVKVTSNDKTKYFYCDLCDLKSFLTDPQVLAQTALDLKVSVAKTENPDLKISDLLEQGVAEPKFDKLSINTEFAVFACFVDEDFKIGDIEYAIIKTGKGIFGPFSITNGQVIFSPGNLQHQASTGLWRFAENQWEIVGDGNKNTAPDYVGWIDVFSWGTGNNPTLVSSDKTDFPEFAEWGDNPISNGGNEPKQWRTLSFDDWKHILWDRKGADQLFGLGTIDNVRGLILLPDDWTQPATVSFIPGSKENMEKTSPSEYHDQSDLDHFLDNVYTSDPKDYYAWKKMEDEGAIFLPVTTYRYFDGTTPCYAEEGGSTGTYWACDDKNNANRSWGLTFNKHAIFLALYSVERGYSVRLVQDVK